MPVETFYARGHSDVGFVIAAADESLGRTMPEGVALQLATSSIDLGSAQTLMPVDTGITDATFNFVVRLVSAALKRIQRLYGLPESAHTGDLVGGPTAEVLEIQDTELGSVEHQLYSLGPGPVSTRRIDVFRSRVADLGELVQAKTGWMLPQATWRALAPDTGPVVRITDAT